MSLLLWFTSTIQLHVVLDNNGMCEKFIHSFEHKNVWSWHFARVNVSKLICFKYTASLIVQVALKNCGWIFAQNMTQLWPGKTLKSNSKECHSNNTCLERQKQYSFTSHPCRDWMISSFHKQNTGDKSTSMKMMDDGLAGVSCWSNAGWKSSDEDTADLTGEARMRNIKQDIFHYHILLPKSEFTLFQYFPSKIGHLLILRNVTEAHILICSCKQNS